MKKKYARDLGIIRFNKGNYAHFVGALKVEKEGQPVSYLPISCATEHVCHKIRIIKL